MPETNQTATQISRPSVTREKENAVTSITPYTGDYILQNTVITAILTADMSKAHYDELAGKYTIEYSEDLKIEITPAEIERDQNGDPLPPYYKTSTRKLWGYIMYTASKGIEDGRITLDFFEYCKYRKITPKKYAFDTFWKDISTLFDFKINTSIYINGKNVFSMDSHVFSDKITKDEITNTANEKRPVLLLSEKFNAMLTNPGEIIFYMPFTTDYLAINDRAHPHAYLLIWAINQHMRINCDNKRKNLISISELLKKCVTLAKKEKIKAARRNYTQKIREPFENDMGYLSDSRGLKYEYADNKGNVLKGEDLSFSEWEKSYILIKENPDYTGSDTITAARKSKRIEAARKIKEDSGKVSEKLQNEKPQNAENGVNTR